MEFLRLLDSQFMPIIDEPEQVTPVMEQQAVLLVGETEVVFPINCQIRTTQQHWGDDKVQVAWDSTPAINAERVNDSIEFLRAIEIICLLFKGFVYINCALKYAFLKWVAFL